MTLDHLEPRGLRPHQAAAYTGMTEDWLKRARIYGQVDGVDGPPYHRISEQVLLLYYRDELDAWLETFPAMKHNQATA